MAALAVVVTSMFAVIQIADQRDEVVATAVSAKDAARDAKAVALNTERLALSIRDLLAIQAPCNPGDPPESLGCVRQARTDAWIATAVARISEALAGGLALHDLNVHRDLEELRRRLAAASSPLPPQRTIAPAPPAPGPAASPPAAVDPPPATTTTPTTCPRLPNGRCRK